MGIYDDQDTTSQIDPDTLIYGAAAAAAITALGRYFDKKSRKNAIMGSVSMEPPVSPPVREFPALPAAGPVTTGAPAADISTPGESFPVAPPAAGIPGFSSDIPRMNAMMQTENVPAPREETQPVEEDWTTDIVQRASRHWKPVYKLRDTDTGRYQTRMGPTGKPEDAIVPEDAIEHIKKYMYTKHGRNLQEERVAGIETDVSKLLDKLPARGKDKSAAQDVVSEAQKYLDENLESLRPGTTKGERAETIKTLRSYRQRLIDSGLSSVEADGVLYRLAINSGRKGGYSSSAYENVQDIDESDALVKKYLGLGPKLGYDKLRIELTPEEEAASQKSIESSEEAAAKKRLMRYRWYNKGGDI